MKISCIELNFKVTHLAAPRNDYVTTDKTRLVNLAPILLFSEYKLNTSGEKRLKRIDLAHVRLMSKLLPCSKDRNVLSVQFDGGIQRREEDMTNRKEAPIKGRCHVRIF